MLKIRLQWTTMKIFAWKFMIWTCGMFTQLMNIMTDSVRYQMIFTRSLGFSMYLRMSGLYWGAICDGFPWSHKTSLAQHCVGVVWHRAMLVRCSAEFSCIYLTRITWCCMTLSQSCERLCHVMFIRIYDIITSIVNFFTEVIQNGFLQRWFTMGLTL